MIHFQLLYQSIELPMFFSSRNYGMYPISASFPVSFLNRTIISSLLELLELELLVLEISMFSLYDFDKRVNTFSLLLSDK